VSQERAFPLEARVVAEFCVCLESRRAFKFVAVQNVGCKRAGLRVSLGFMG